MRPDVADDPSAGPTPTKSATLLEAVVAMMNENQVWAGPASELLFELEPLASGLPQDGTRMSKELFGIGESEYREDHEMKKGEDLRWKILPLVYDLVQEGRKVTHLP
jgi:hypothetical protein